jgi:hypothetical protein
LLKTSHHVNCVFVLGIQMSSSETGRLRQMHYWHTQKTPVFPKFKFPISLWRKVVCLLCLCRWDLPNPDVSCHALLYDWKCLMSRGAPSWFHNVSTYSAVEKLLTNRQNFHWKSI